MLLAGQAFAKHYNPLLSGETSYGSQYSSDKTPNAVAMRRFGEAALPNSLISSTPQDSSNAGVQCTASSQHTAPSNEAMHGPHDTTLPAAAAQPTRFQRQDRATDGGQDLAPSCSGTHHTFGLQGLAGQGFADQGVAHQGVEDQEVENQRVADQHGGGLQGVVGQSRQQSSLGRQLGDALKLRNWKPNRQQPISDPPADGVSFGPSQALSPRTESAMMVAASQLGFDANQGGGLEQAAQPSLPAPDCAVVE